MGAEQRLSQVLTEKLGFYVPISEVDYETVWFLKEELDEELIPADVLAPLADPVIADSASYTADNGDYYYVAIIETGHVVPHEIWLINGKLVADFADGILHVESECESS